MKDLIILLIWVVVSILACKTSSKINYDNATIVTPDELQSQCIDSTVICKYDLITNGNERVTFNLELYEGSLVLNFSNYGSIPYYIFSGFFNDFFYQTDFIRKIDKGKMMLTFSPQVPSPKHPYHYDYYYFYLLDSRSSLSFNIPLEKLQLGTDSSGYYAWQHATSSDSLKSYRIKEVGVEVGIYTEILPLCLWRQATFLNEQQRADYKDAKEKHFSISSTFEF